MIQVRCESCGATFDLDERRLPKSGMRVRCPRCAESFLVTPPASASGAASDPPGALGSPIRKSTLSFGAETAAAIAAMANPSAGTTPSSPPAPPRRGPPPPPPAAAREPSAMSAMPNAGTLVMPAAQSGATGLPGTEPSVVARNPAGPSGIPLPSGRPSAEPGLPVVRAAVAKAPAGPGASPATPTAQIGTPAVPSAFGTSGTAELPAVFGNAGRGGFMNEPSVIAPNPSMPMGAGGMLDLPVPMTMSHPSTPLDTAFGRNDFDSLASIDLPGGAGDDPLGMGQDSTALLGRVALEKRAIPASALEPQLPTRPAALPISATGAALPSTVGSGVGLPSPVGSRSLPPLPTNEASIEFGGLDLPSVDPMNAGLPAPLRLPDHQPGGTLGGRAGHLIGTDLSDEFDLPVPPGGGGAMPNMRDSFAPGGRNVSLSGNEPSHFDEISLTGRPGMATSNDEFDQVPMEARGQTPPSTANAPFEENRAAASAAVKLHTLDASAPASEGREQRRLGLAITLGAIVTLGLGGAALTLTPYGPFGYYFFDNVINGPERHAAATRVMDSGKHALELDNYAQARATLRNLDAQLERTPGEHALVAFDAFVHYVVLARFGSDGALAGRARTLFDGLGVLPPNTPYVNAARAARELATGHAERVRRLQANDPLLRDLQTSAYLESNAPTDALESARAGVQRRPTPRSRYLLAKAYYVTDDHEAAQRECEALIAAAPEHASARLLLANLLSERPAGRDRAIALAQQVQSMATNASPDERTEAAVLVGQIELARDRLPQAREAFTQALQLDPRSPDALVGAANIEYRQNNFTEALARFQAAQSADPTKIEAKLGIAMASIGLNQPAVARETLEPLITEHANDPRVHLWLARALLAMNEQASSEREFREAIRLDNSNLEAYTTLASLLFTMQRPEAAEQVLQEARAHVSDQALIHRALGEGRYNLRQYAGAKTELETAIAAHPNDARAHFLLARVLRKLREYPGASRELETVQHIDPTFDGLLVERGTLAEERGDAAAALPVFRQALARDPQNAELVVRVGSCLVSTGQFAEADSQLSHFVSEHPNNPEALYVLGRAQLGLNNITDAVRLLERAAELDVGRADFRAYAGQANLVKTQYARALEHANKAIETDPTYARGFWVRAEVEVRLGHQRDGLVDAAHAYQLDPSLVEAEATWAAADDGLGHPDEAITLYRNAIAARPNQPEWHFRLGSLLQDRGDTAGARSEYTRATSLGDALNPAPSWLALAHRMLADALRDSDRTAAREHYERFLQLAPSNAPGINDARRAVVELTRN